MSNLLENIPQAVAAIVEKHFVHNAHEKREDQEARLIALADKLYRTLAKATLDANAGEPWPKK